MPPMVLSLSSITNEEYILFTATLILWAAPLRGGQQPLAQRERIRMRAVVHQSQKNACTAETASAHRHQRGAH